MRIKKNCKTNSYNITWNTQVEDKCIKKNLKYIHHNPKFPEFLLLFIDSEVKVLCFTKGKNPHFITTISFIK
jgi:hypothetical protein